MNEISAKARAAGVVGAGGAGFPMHVKLEAAAEIYLVNGAECEPLLKVDQQLAVKYADLLVRGLALAMQAVGAREGIVALKAKYAEAIEVLTPRLRPGMRIHILKDAYMKNSAQEFIRMLSQSTSNLANFALKDILR